MEKTNALTAGNGKAAPLTTDLTNAPQSTDLTIKASDVESIALGVIAYMEKHNGAVAHPVDLAVAAVHSVDGDMATIKAIGIGVVKGLARAYGRQVAVARGWLKDKAR